jgi:hypothetical protein
MEIYGEKLYSKMDKNSIFLNRIKNQRLERKFEIGERGRAFS